MHNARRLASVRAFSHLSGHRSRSISCYPHLTKQAPGQVQALPPLNFMGPDKWHVSRIDLAEAMLSYARSASVAADGELAPVVDHHRQG
jgi:hypothetical protein